jgi:hypothetical protein
MRLKDMLRLKKLLLDLTVSNAELSRRVTADGGKVCAERIRQIRAWETGDPVITEKTYNALMKTIKRLKYEVVRNNLLRG